MEQHNGGTTSLMYLAVVSIADVLLDMVALASWHGDFFEKVCQNWLHIHDIHCSRGGGNWGTLRIPARKIGEH